jgi:Zn-finger nucleic acid-binding protein
MDPYRGSSQVGTCPRCSNPTETDGEIGRLVCAAGCGEWYPRAAFERVWAQITAALGTPAQPWPWSPPECPDCKRAMATGYREEVRFDFCPLHGVWLDSGEYERFATLFAGS